MHHIFASLVTRSFVACLFPAAVSVAQTEHLTAHPQETLQNGNGHIIPFGCADSSGTFAEGRAQMLLRALELPGPGAVLVGMEVHSQMTANFLYASLVIQCEATTSTALSFTFANNLSAPTTVLSATALPVAWQSNAWVRVPFTLPYVHDGTSSLVIDIAKVVDPSSFQFATMSTSSSPPRTDRPTMVYSLGGAGSGAAAATNAITQSDGLSIRLVWLGVPTLRHRSDLGASFQQYSMGGSIAVTVSGTAGSLYLNQIGTSLLPVPAPLPPLVGLLRISGVTYVVSFLDGAGLASSTINIPNNPGLVGSYFVHQSAVLDAFSNLPMFTNAMDHFLNP